LNNSSDHGVKTTHLITISLGSISLSITPSRY